MYDIARECITIRFTGSQGLTDLRKMNGLTGMIFPNTRLLFRFRSFTWVQKITGLGIIRLFTNQAYAVSLATGLPLSAVMLSRTSINQTLLNLDLVLDPYHDFPVLELLPNQKPYLLIQHKKGSLSHYEDRLLNKARLVDENQILRVFSLETDSIRSLLNDRHSELKSIAETDSFMQDSPEVLYEDFSSAGDGMFKGDFTRPVTFFDAVIPDTGWYEVSFWYEGTDRDLWPRTVFWTELFRMDGSKYRYLYTDFFRKMVLRDGSWGLIEYPIHVEEPNSTLKITMKNAYVTHGEMILDQVLVKPRWVNHVVHRGEQFQVNNRVLLSDCE